MPPTGSGALLTVLGAGTLLPDAHRHSASFHLQLERGGLLLDCGTGTLHGLARRGLPWRDIDVIAISHYHSDHVGDLPALLAALKFSGRTRPLTLLGPAGFRGFLGRLADAFGSYVLDPGFPLRVTGITEAKGWVDAEMEIGVGGISTPHTEESIALKIDGAWGRVGYTGDTGPSADVAAFLTGCTLLIAECALADPPEMNTHLSPEGVGALARVARPELLVLSHVYPPQTPQDAVSSVSAVYDGKTVAAADGARFQLSLRGVAVAPSAGDLYTS